MKNNSQNNYSKKNLNKKNRKYNSKNTSKSSHFSEDKNISNISNNNNKVFSINKKDFYQPKLKNNRDKSLNPIRTNSYNKNTKEELLRKNNNNSYQKQTNNKNLDDWIWGKHSVYEALTGDRPINRVWCTSEVFSSERFYVLLKELKSNGVLVEEVTWSRLAQLTFGATHQGIAIQIAYSKSLPLSQLIEFSKINSTNPIILALDGITDPHNVGAIIRSAEAFDCKGVIIPQRRSAGLSGTVAKVAAGALEHISVSRVVNLNRAIEELKRNGFLAVGLTGEGNISISKFNEKAPLVVIVGAEDKGISLLTQKRCDFLLNIPLKGKTSSLNASVAAAISLFHLTNK